MNSRHVYEAAECVVLAVVAPRKDRQPRPEAAYTGSTHWQRHRTPAAPAARRPWMTAPSHGPLLNHRSMLVNAEEDAVFRAAVRRFAHSFAGGGSSTKGNHPHSAPYQRKVELRDASFVKEELRDTSLVKAEPANAPIHSMKEESKEVVPMELDAPNPGIGANARAPYFERENAVYNDPPRAIVEPPPPIYVLSREQQEVLNMVRSGHNVFFTGSAGS